MSAIRHDAREAAHRAGPSATADACLYLPGAGHRHIIDKYLDTLLTNKSLQCFDAVGGAAGRAPGL